MHREITTLPADMLNRTLRDMKNQAVKCRAGEPEREAMEPADFGGAGAFLNISSEQELEPKKFY